MGSSCCQEVKDGLATFFFFIMALGISCIQKTYRSRKAEEEEWNKWKWLKGCASKFCGENLVHEALHLVFKELVIRYGDEKNLPSYRKETPTPEIAISSAWK